MNRTSRWISNSRKPLHRFIATLAALAALVAGLSLAPARADTTISGTVTYTSATDFGTAGIITMNNGAILQVNYGANGNYTINNAVSWQVCCFTSENITMEGHRPTH